MGKDLGVKVGTPAAVLWTNLLKTEEENLEKNKVAQQVGEMLIELAKKQIAKEKGKI